MSSLAPAQSHWPSASKSGPRPVYTTAERARRDATVWTAVQAVLAPLQFLVFLVSLVLVLTALFADIEHTAAAISVVLKTAILLTIMLTGSIWEKVVFGKFLFAPSFFWEDVVSMAVIALHLAYVAALLAGWGTASDQLWIALAAYVAYAINAAQFLFKMVRAKREAPVQEGAL
ncbi:MAG: 2-vinyl bacteriochlorophyllide hydratase [Pseudomonadota bacterium]